MRKRITRKEKGNFSLSRTSNIAVLVAGLLASVIFYACNTSAGSAYPGQGAVQALPVITLSHLPATTYQEF